MARILFKLLGIIVLCASLVGGWLLMDIRQFMETPLNIGGEGIQCTIPPGTSFSRFAHDLAGAGVLRHPNYLAWLARWQGRAQQIKAGEYFIMHGTTGPQLIDQVVSGAVMQHALTLVEGWTFRQVMEAVNDSDVLTHTLNGLDEAHIMERLGLPGIHPEGRFLPDTYNFPRGMTDVAFLKRAYEAMQGIVDEEWSRRSEGLPYQIAYEALIMASIIEKESALHAEREEIASVFVRRLLLGMRLQTDPTVIYGLGPGFNGNITRRDLMTDSPYNTYLYAGLTPTPIAMPSKEAIHAALHPAPGKALYFVSRGDGSHQFSETLEQHNKAVRRYQLNSK